ncbi:MAG: hypothetical protein JNL18_22985 [Planctomycetaceae bacterium]|nr:hypothetical protein [Planctomycetaceae bacterium]
MPDRKHASSSHCRESDAGHASREITSSPKRPPTENPEAFERRAQMVARGELPFPGGVPDDDQRAIVSRVREIRKERLLEYVARVIAMDIHRERSGR